MKSYLKILSAFSILGLVVFACAKMAPNTSEDIGIKTIFQSAEDAKNQIAETLKKTSIQLADGLEIKLWATDSLSPDPVALSIDKNGAVYITRAVRPTTSEFDIRGHRDWMTESIRMQSIEDRRAFLHKIFSDENSEENNWLTDLNGDGLHNWKDLAVEKEEVWKMEDTDGDGIADKSTRVLQDFNEEITDVANGILVRDHDMFVTVGPDMWRLEDTDMDGYYDKKTSLCRGFNVHIGFGGHGVSGIIEGPDGKIYWGAGDIGANLTDLSGKNHFYPNQGVIVRCNPDGSDFEVFSHGHRNTHEFVFDQFGNLIAADNDGDHPGESERLVHVVEGSDSGWRINWQFGKYTDPLNNGYKVWMDEKLFVPRWDGQASYIIPPIQNFHNGPTGMVFNPGAGLGKKWQNRFFLVEFVGNPTRSHIWSFSLRPNGASFELKDDIDMMSGLLPTGMRFAPDGSLFFSDWLNGWDVKSAGRVWRIDVDSKSNDLAELRKKTEFLVKSDFDQVGTDSLATLLAWEDMRIRQKAQFELVARGNSSASVFFGNLDKTTNQLSRIHSIWGLGQILYKDASIGNKLMTYLNDVDAEVVAQSAKVIGDARFKAAESALLGLLKSPNPRIQFYAAQALGRIEAQSATEPLLKMLSDNADKDVYMRHVAVLALGRIGNASRLAETAKSNDRAVRMGGLLALRRMKNANVALFLNDIDEHIVTDAARAINDDFSIEAALPALAQALATSKVTNEAFVRRAINANLRVGDDASLDRLIAYAKRNDITPELRAEAMATLSTWSNPSVLDRVDGRYRGEFKRSDVALKSKVEGLIGPFLTSEDEEVKVAAIQLVSRLGLTKYGDQLFGLLTKAKKSEVKEGILEALVSMKSAKAGEAVSIGLQDGSRSVRTEALKYLDQVNMNAATFSKVAMGLLANGSVKEKQQLVSVMSKLPLSNTTPIFEKLIADYAKGDLDQNLNLELEEALTASNAQSLLDKFNSTKPKGDGLEAFKDALYGGDYMAGRQFFRNNSTAQCSRCHMVQGQGGQVGPDLSKIGSELDREQILEALIAPSARLAPGFGFVSLTLKDGQEVNGVLMKESKDELELHTDEAAEPLRVATARIARRENMPSSMPPMGLIMSKREIRDVVAYLSAMK
ncbi:putative membrane-bound dehydrogenase domain-containing protein [Spirosomataceae bacterium TFI 002]|nr:putative membrane-bound dehydrogenase domain-containing protein [Spirosomataceae bacterium TFI 002]